jgi:hypothetical protein
VHGSSILTHISNISRPHYSNKYLTLEEAKVQHPSSENERKDIRLSTIGVEVWTAASVLHISTIPSPSDRLISTDVNPCTIAENASSLMSTSKGEAKGLAWRTNRAERVGHYVQRSLLVIRKPPFWTPYKPSSDICL